MDGEIWEEFANDRDRLNALAQAIRSFSQGIDQGTIGAADGYEETLEAPEGRILTRSHLVRERNRGLVQKKKAQAFRTLSKLECEVCGFSYPAMYGTIGDGFIECHHIVPLAKLEPGQTTKLSDLALVCANCHRMLHRGGDAATIALLRSIVQNQHEK